MQIFGEKGFENPIKTIVAFDNESFKKAFSQIENLRKRSDTYLFGYIRYEAKDIFLGKKIKSNLPLLYFEVFNNYKTFKSNSIEDGSILTAPLISFKEYSNAISKIKHEIAYGNTYEVNYTYDWKVKADLAGYELFKSILPRQKTYYNAYIKNEYDEILSFSPELFFEIEGNKILTKPMKGTIKRGENLKEDMQNIKILQKDEKNLAENIMIVDLLRNDLSKIAKTGTVKADKLFEVETHPTLHQMTSEITAEIKENITLFDIFEAIFPCGSITGAPKINTMEIIEKLEKGNRGVYCGAIGLISSEKTVFSVPIRILQKTTHEKFFHYRVGGAIVWDSTAKEEWEETLTKINFLQPNFQLVETMLVENKNILFFKEHILRMQNAANNLCFNFDLKQLESKLEKIKFDSDCILRILLDKQGVFETQNLPLNEIKTNRVIVSKTPVKSSEKLLYYKTTYRPWYKNSSEKIKQGKIFDEIYFNEKGELTEGSRSNIILQIGKELFTPPIKCGLLNGVMRENLIENKKVKEKILKRDDLKNAKKVFCINSVRKIVEVEIDL